MHFQYTEMKKENLLSAAYLEMCVQIPQKLIMGLLVIYSAVFPGKRNNELKT